MQNDWDFVDAILLYLYSPSVPSRRSIGNQLTLLCEDIQENFMIDDSCGEVLQQEQVRFSTTMIYFGAFLLCERA